MYFLLMEYIYNIDKYNIIITRENENSKKNHIL